MKCQQFNNPFNNMFIPVEGWQPAAQSVGMPYSRNIDDTNSIRASWQDQYAEAKAANKEEKRETTTRCQFCSQVFKDHAAHMRFHKSLGGGE